MQSRSNPNPNVHADSNFFANQTQTQANIKQSCIKTYGKLPCFVANRDESAGESMGNHSNLHKTRGEQGGERSNEGADMSKKHVNASNTSPKHHFNTKSTSN